MIRHSKSQSLSALCLFFLTLTSSHVLGGDLHEEMPIRYWDRSPRDFTRDWARAADQGELQLDNSSEQAFLLSVLDELGISPASQVLVFSQTSFQVDLIRPNLPRALYFNKDHYVGWVPGGDLEVATVDGRTGMNFYQVPVPEENAAPEFIRNRQCLSCHGGNRDVPFPRTMLFSVFATEEGAQVLRGTTHNVDHRTPIDKRWGGWYVTGTKSGPRHRGNFFSAPNPDLPEEIDPTAGDTDMGAHRQDLAEVVDLSAYPASTSDILALLVLEHQSLAHNQLMRTYGNTRIALWSDENFFSDGKLAPETMDVIHEEVDGLLEVFLFKDEASLEGHEFEPSSAYRKAFLAPALRDSRGRSLRDLDLESRLFRYRFSFMVHSEAFEFLPDEVKEVFFEKLENILAGRNPDYAYLPAEERRAIREILTETLPGFPSTE